MRPKNNVAMISLGKREDMGIYKIDRLLPNRYKGAIGPVVLLDHILPLIYKPKHLMEKEENIGPRPSRGLATLTYIVNGQIEHRDSKGNHTKINSGGLQWMKAGNGIIHDERLNIDPGTNDLLIHSFQFWINLPSQNKAEDADYLFLASTDIPKRALSNKCGWIKILIGKYKGLSSKIPTHSLQFIYHLHLEAGRCFALKTTKKMSYAAFLPLQDAVINDSDYHKGELVGFDQIKGEIEIKNVSADPVDVILFGGEPYPEPTIISGEFVMNTEHEISLAYNDYYDGKYGQIDDGFQQNE
jgi:hypothetical protein